MKYLIKLKGWIGADAIQESDVSARDAGERWARKQVSLMPGERRHPLACTHSSTRGAGPA